MKSAIWRITGAFKGQGWHRTVSLALPLLFLAAMLLVFPYHQRFEFDLDEGLDAMKALMVARGYPLYTQIWSDQPPLLTYLLAACFRIFGADINAGRTLILLLSTSLLVAAAQIVRLTWGAWHSLACSLLIILLPFYPSLSASIMYTEPVTAFAMLSLLALTLWHQRREDRWLVLSGLAMGLSVLTKLMLGILAPIFVAGLLIGERGRMGSLSPLSRLLRPALLWSAAFALLALAGGLVLVGPSNLDQLFTSHLAARGNPAFIDLANSQSIAWHLRDSWTILLLGGIGGLFVVLERRWTSLYLLAWTLAAYGMLSYHAPVWYHHQHFVSIPAAMLGAIAVGEAARKIPELIRSRAFLNPRWLLVLLAVAGLGAALGTRARLTYHSFILPAFLVPPEAPSEGRELPFLTEMGGRADKTEWAVTDLPMYAFRAGLSVPPTLAAITDKRLASGELTQEQIIQVIEEYKPEQVLLGRFNLPLVEAYLKEDYRRIYQWGRKTLYLHGELKRNP